MAAPELRLADFPPGSEIKRLISPSYRTRAPEIVNAGLIPDEARQKMAAAWDARFVPEGRVCLHRVRDCFVVGEGLVFDRDLALIRPSLAQHSLEEAAAGLGRIEQALQHQTVPSLPTALLACKRGAANYFHWVVEMLPMAHLGLRWGLPADTVFLVPGEPLAAVVADSMALLGVPPERLRPCWEPTHVGELLMVTGLSHHGVWLSPLVLEALDAVAAEVRPGPFRKLWVSREDSKRRLLHETDLCRTLYTQGWAVAAPGLFPFTQQVALFKGARQIAGVCGAGLANLAFAPRGPEVTVFTPADMPEPMFWLLCEQGGKRYREVRGPLAEGARGIEKWDGELALSLPEVLAQLG